MSANLSLDLETIGNAFVVVVVGGMGSIPGAFVAALIIAEIKALCIGIGHVTLFGVGLSLSRFTLVAEFVVMAVVLVVRPWGLLGRASAAVRGMAAPEAPLRPAGKRLKWLAAIALLILLLAPLTANAFPYMPVLLVEILIAVLFATSLHFIMGPGGMHSFGHAAYFGLGAYGAALFLKVLNSADGSRLALGPLLAVAGALVFGWFAVRLSGVYLAMLTLAFAQIVWSVVFQWDDVTGGCNGILGLWPSNWLSSPVAFYYLTLTCAVIGVLLLRRMLFSPLGYAMRASRDSVLRAEAIGIDVKRVQWTAFAIASRSAVSRVRVCILQGHDIAGSDQREPFRRRTRHGAARRLPDVDRTDRRRDCFHCPAGQCHAPDRVLARPARCGDPAAGAGVPRWHRRRAEQAAGGAEKAGMSILSIRDLSKAFGGIHAVDNVSFDVGDGEFLALIGPNGAGKSTCFNMINGQLAPDRGDIRFADRSIVGLHPRDIWRRGVGRTFQVAATFGSMTVAENVQMALVSHHKEIFRFGAAFAGRHHARAVDLLDQVGMADAAARPCKELAYGDVKRVELAIALANDPRLLLMDEPTAGMASRERHDLIALVKRLVIEREISVLFTEHSMDVVFAYADRIIVLARGMLIADGNAETIRDNAQVQAVYLGTGSTYRPRTEARP